MAEITAQMVKELRESTGAGMLDCKNALAECNGDFEKAVQHLREKGLGKAAKKADRLAAEGLVSVKISDDFKSATLTEINSETDFVAKNENFIKLTQDTTAHIQRVFEFSNRNHRRKPCRAKICYLKGWGKRHFKRLYPHKWARGRHHRCYCAK